MAKECNISFNGLHDIIKNEAIICLNYYRNGWLDYSFFLGLCGPSLVQPGGCSDQLQAASSQGEGTMVRHYHVVYTYVE